MMAAVAGGALAATYSQNEDVLPIVVDTESLRRGIEDGLHCQTGTPRSQLEREGHLQPVYVLLTYMWPAFHIARVAYLRQAVDLDPSAALVLVGPVSSETCRPPQQNAEAWVSAVRIGNEAGREMGVRQALQWRPCCPSSGSG